MPIKRREKFSFLVLLHVSRIERKKVKAEVDKVLMGELLLF